MEKCEFRKNQSGKLCEVSKGFRSRKREDKDAPSINHGSKHSGVLGVFKGHVPEEKGPRKVGTMKKFWKTGGKTDRTGISRGESRRGPQRGLNVDMKEKKEGGEGDFCELTSSEKRCSAAAQRSIVPARELHSRSPRRQHRSVWYGIPEGREEKSLSKGKENRGSRGVRQRNQTETAPVNEGARDLVSKNRKV